MDVDEMIRQILNAIDEIEGMQCRDQWSNPEWTRKIKTALCEVGTLNGYEVCASGVDVEPNNGEWLYDVCWLDYAGNDENWLRSMPMAAESEWGDWGAIDDDFSKILVSGASLRVMVCDSGYLPNDTEGQATAERLQQTVGEYNGSWVGDTYLLIVYERLHSWRYRLEVIQAGELPALTRL